MKKIDKINIKFVKLSLILSLIAIGISIYFGIQSNHYVQKQIELEEKSTQSKLVAQIEIDYGQNSVIFEEINLSEYKTFYKQKYILLLNNIGQVNTSITDFYVTVESKMFNSDKIGYGSFSGMGPSYYNIDGEKLNLPISIEPNKPKKIVMEVGVKVPLKAWKKTSNILEFNQVYDYWETEEIFQKIGHPAMGQLDLIKDSAYGDKGYLQKYHLNITKGDGKRVGTWFHHHVSNHLQGEIN